MKNLIKIILAISCIISFSSCKVAHTYNEETPPPSPITPADPGPTFTCEDLKAINRILFITFSYDKKYDLDNDTVVTVQDKLIIENDLLKYKAVCVTALRTCDDLQAVKDEVQTFTDLVNTPIVVSAIASSIIYHESGQKCVNDFNTGSFIGDVNKNGYIECNDPMDIQLYVIGQSPSNFDPALADLNVSSTISALDALYVKLALNALFINYMNNLGACL